MESSSCEEEGRPKEVIQDNHKFEYLCVKIQLKTKEGKLLNSILLQNIEKISTTINQKSKQDTGTKTISSISEADGKSNGDKITEAIPIGDESADCNTSYYVPVEEIYVGLDEDLSTLDSKVLLGLPWQF